MPQPPKRGVFLDRDGVLNRSFIRDGKPYPPRSAAEFEILPGVLDALQKLKAAGFTLIVVTNQPDIARGKDSRQSIEALNTMLQEQLPMLDDVLVCPHDDKDNCVCRKPKPGLLLSGAISHGLSLPRCYMVGDRWRDVEAGQAAGCQTVWINVGYLERGPAKPPSFETTSLPAAAEWILTRGNV